MVLKKSRIYRLLEIMPGFLMWATFFVAIILSFINPLIIVYYIIIFDLYWLFKVFYFTILLGFSWKRYQETIKTNWLEKASVLSRFSGLHHLIILPTFKEDRAIVRRALQSLVDTHYPQGKFIVVLAGEENDKENFQRIARDLQGEFDGRFKKLLITLHPNNIPGEVIGKGSNIHYAEERAKELIDEMRIPYDNIIVSVFDIDTLAHPEYFGYLAHTYLTHPNPTRASYQPVALYTNNIWESPAPVRIAAFGTTFWLMTELARPEKLVTFSSHSMSFRALVEVGFHPADVVSEDSRIFLKCFMHYHGAYEVVPLFIPVYMNTVRTVSYSQSLLNLYKQLRRWAYGAENIPYLISGFWRDRTISAMKKIRYGWTLIEGAHSLATAPILIFILGRLPLLVAKDELRAYALVSNTPFTLEKIMTLAMLGIFLSAILSMILLPPRPKTMSPLVILTMIGQWILMPVTFIIFGSIPAVDAQTRLMVGKYLRFTVTEKK